MGKPYGRPGSLMPRRHWKAEGSLNRSAARTTGCAGAGVLIIGSIGFRALALYGFGIDLT